MRTEALVSAVFFRKHLLALVGGCGALLLTGCTVPNQKWVKRHSEYGYKSLAFAECGHDYRVVEYREEEVLVECLEPLD
ncbi:MAG: hypothetical protein ACO4AU_07740 [bacterium]|jgi:hypothetical protein